MAISTRFDQPGTRAQSLYPVAFAVIDKPVRLVVEQQRIRSRIRIRTTSLKFFPSGLELLRDILFVMFQHSFSRIQFLLNDVDRRERKRRCTNTGVASGVNAP